MKKQRKIDLLINAITISASMLSILVLGMIIVFIFSKGLSTLSWQLIISDNQAKNYLALVNEEQTMSFEKPDNLDDEVFWSEKWGIGVVDHLAIDKKAYILVEQVAANSALAKMVDNKGKLLQLKPGSVLSRLSYIDAQGNIEFAGSQTLQDAKSFILAIDQATMIDSVYFQILGGGIRGSLISTLWLIGLSLLFSLPIGLASAIYLIEYAKKNRFTKLLQSSIETLSGVPSIVFGLMGVVVFYPVTAFFGASGLSILLGAMTMSVILLPTIIRSTQEALIVIPQSLRDGSYGVGATQSQTIFKIVLPSALPGILTGVLLSIGRIIGESAALIYTMGVFANDIPGILKPSSSLAVHIWGIMSGEQPSFELAAAVSIIILIIVFTLNILVKYISNRLSKAWY